MSTPTITQTPTRPPAPPPRRRRPLALLVAGAVLAIAVGSGAALAFGDRTARSDAAATQPTSAPAVQPAPAPTPAPKVVVPAPAPNSSKDDKVSTPTTDSGSGLDTLADGSHPGYISRIDASHDRIVVDLVQAFTGEDAVKAAIEDGMDRDAAQVRDIYVRNQNDRLRTLPLASDVRVNLLQTCEGGGGRDQQLATLAKHASNHLFYYTFQVRGGSVQQIEEHLANPAC